MEESQLAQALASVQKALPKIDKGKTATVPTKNGGQYSYKYADLSDITEKLMPLLAENGLAWLAKPTLLDGGVFVLQYKLLHTSGDFEEGAYPLGSPNGRPQDTGSAITYARRYALCSVVGVVPDEDDDGQGAEQAYQRSHQQRQEPKAQSGAVVDKGEQEATDALNGRIANLPKESADPIRARIEKQGFPYPFPPGAMRMVTKWIEEAESGAPF